MKEELISFETTKLAKEKGFNEYTQGGYYIFHKDHKDNYKNKIPADESKMFLVRDSEDYDRLINIDEDTYHQVYHCYCVPTQSLLQRWLREVHSLNVCIDQIGYNEIDAHFSFRCIVKRITRLSTDVVAECRSGIEGDWYIFRNYEAALEKGLQEALKLIKE